MEENRILNTFVRLSYGQQEKEEGGLFMLGKLVYWGLDLNN